MEVTELWYAHHKYLGEVGLIPRETYSEVDDGGWEVRRVDFFKDGTVGYADRTSYTGEAELSERPLIRPSASSDTERWRAIEITQQTFEEIWARAFAGEWPLCGPRTIDDSKYLAFWAQRNEFR